MLCGVGNCANPHSSALCSRASLASTKVRGIIHTVAERGTARLILDDDFRCFSGVLLNQNEDCFEVIGRLCEGESAPDLSKASTSAATSFRVNFTVVDGDTGDKFEIPCVPVQLEDYKHPITAAEHVVVRVDHPALKFHAEEVLIGNKADVAIHRFIDPKRSGDSKKVLVGPMTLKVVAQERTAPTTRRFSECVNAACETYIEQSNDFLA